MIWLDAQLPPRLALWISDTLKTPCQAVRDLGLLSATDPEIFERARADMVTRKGSPPKVIWLRCGNTSEEQLRELLDKQLARALQFLECGEDLIELR